MEEVKIQVLNIEQRLLESIGYNFHLTHPQKYTLKLSKLFKIQKEPCQLAYRIAQNT